MWQSKRKLPSSPNHERENQNILYTPGPQSELAFPHIPRGRDTSSLYCAPTIGYTILPLLPQLILFCDAFQDGLSFGGRSD
jgi:hypothetical protein